MIRKPVSRLAGIVMACLGASAAFSATETPLARDGTALLPVVTAERPDPMVRQAASDLAAYLQKTSGAAFETKIGDGASGIAVGTAQDFDALPFKEELAVKGLAGREHYILRSHSKGLYVIGATPLAVRDAVWDLLYRLGYRQFFPPAEWEVIPHAADLQVALDVDEQPDYLVRDIAFANWGDHPWTKDVLQKWCARNRMPSISERGLPESGVKFYIGHAYQRIIARNKAAFDTHPEYYGLLNGKRTSTKICIGNPDLRKLVVEDALRQLAEDPTLECVSEEPSDGDSDWCECPLCAALGSESDRVMTLANEVARAVSAKYPDRYVSILAYGGHAPPPQIPIDPHMIVWICNGYIHGGYTVDEVYGWDHELGGWGKKNILLGAYDYYSFWLWDDDLPGLARVGNTSLLKKTLPDFYACGVRFMKAQASNNWGPNGLGYYLTARTLWKVKDAERVDELTADFLDKAFGAAREPMREFYRLMDGANHIPVSDDLIGRMFRLVKEARARTDDPAVLARLNDLALYAHYVELYRAYALAVKSATSLQAYENLCRYAWRIRRAEMVDTAGVVIGPPCYDESLKKAPPETDWDIPEGKNPWKAATPMTAAEISGLIEDGIAAHKLIDFTPVDYGVKLAPAAAFLPATLSAVKFKTSDITTIGTNRFYLWVAKAPAEIHLKVAGGLIPGFRNRGHVRLTLFSAEQESGKAVDQNGDVPPDGAEHEVVLHTNCQGLHILEKEDGGDLTRVQWPDDLPFTLQTGLAEHTDCILQSNLCFYVPRGVRTVGGFVRDGAAEFCDETGKPVHSVKSQGQVNGSYFSFPVPDGHDGAVWTMRNTQGQVSLMTVPPYVAARPSQLLLPGDLLRPKQAVDR